MLYAGPLGSSAAVYAPGPGAAAAAELWVQGSGRIAMVKAGALLQVKSRAQLAAWYDPAYVNVTTCY